MKVVVLLCGLLLVVPQTLSNEPEAPQHLDGSALYADCVETDSSAHAECNGYLAGSVDTIMALVYAKVAAPNFCMPPATTLGAIRNDVVKYVEAHPNSKEWGGSAVIIGALHEAFPCK